MGEIAGAVGDGLPGWPHRKRVERQPAARRAGRPEPDPAGLQGDRIVAEERLLTELHSRIRDVRVDSAGTVYVVTDESDGKLLRLTPAIAGAL